MRSILLLVVCALVGPALASGRGPCSSDGAPAVGVVEITGGSADTTAYLDDRNVALGNGVFVYLETNGVWSAKLPGVYVGAEASQDLQRGESWCNAVSPYCTLDACWDAASDIAGPDLALFSTQR